MTKAQPTRRNRVVLVTGPSGAGRSTAINAFEDLGYESIDNLPLGLIPRLFDGPAHDSRLVLGVDTRTRDFSATALLAMSRALRERADMDLALLYLDCAQRVLLRRFSETRRRHPMAPAEDPETGVRRELDLLTPIREAADTLIDTTDLNVHQLRAQIDSLFPLDSGGPLSVSIQSFSYKRGLPQNADMVLDCRFLTNPYWQPELRAKTGLDNEVAQFVHSDARFAPFFEKVAELAKMLLPAIEDEGKSHFSIAFGCTGGQHRSVTVAQALAGVLDAQGKRVSVRHRELERRRTGD